MALSLCILLGYMGLHGQVMVDMKYSSSQMVHIKDLRNFSINNSSGSQFQCIIQIEITKDDKVVSIGESAPVVLPAGNINMLTWNGAAVNQSSTPANAGAIRSDGTFSGGAYLACIKILDVRDRAELAINCEGFSVADSRKPSVNTNAADPSKKDDGKKKFPIKFSGNAEVSGYFANQPPMFSEYSANYGHVFLNPTLTIYDVPLTGSVLVSTQNSPLRQNMNVYNFSFDADAFKSNLINRLKKAVVENKKLNELTGGKMATLGKIQNLDNLMQNPEVQKELQGLKDLDVSRKKLEEIQGISSLLEEGNPMDGVPDLGGMDYGSLGKEGIPGKMPDLTNLDAGKITDIGKNATSGLPNPNDLTNMEMPKIPKELRDKANNTGKDTLPANKDLPEATQIDVGATDSPITPPKTNSILPDSSSKTKELETKFSDITENPLGKGKVAGMADKAGVGNIANTAGDRVGGIGKTGSGLVKDMKNSIGTVSQLKEINRMLKSTKDSLEHGDTSKVNREKMEQRYKDLSAKADSLHQVYDKYKGKYDSLKTAADSLTGIVNSLKHLDFKKGGYDALLKQKDDLMKNAKLNGWMDSLGNAKNTAEDLAKLDMSKVNDPEYLTQQLSSMGLLKKYEKYLSWIRKFSLGTSFTQFSEYSLNNVPVSGVSVELAPWKLYAAFTYGQVQRSVLTQEVGAASYKRNLIAGSFGYGTQEKTHFHINVLSSQDDPGSINPRDSVYLYYKKPQSNKVIGADFGINLMKDRIRITGELSGSQLVRDVTYQQNQNIIELQDTVLRSEKDWITNIFRQKPVNLNTVTDFAFFTKAETSLFKDKTKISVGASRVGENYHSFGTPFLMRDLLTFEGKVSQKFMKNKISASLYIRQMSNNLDNNKPLTVNQWRWGGDLSLNFPKMPVVRIAYTPILQQNDSGTVNMNMMSANVSYPTKVKKIRIVNMLSYIFQNGTKGFYSEGFTSHFTTFNQNIMFPKGQTFSGTFSYIYTKTSLETLHSLTGSISASMTFLKKWNNGAGVNVYANKMEQRYMLFFRTGISFLKYLTLNVQVEGQIYRNGRSNALYPMYDVIAVRPLLNIRW